MRTCATRIFAGLMVCLAAGGVAVRAQDQGENNQGARYAALIDNVDLLIDNYARYLGTKYGLSGEQDQYTKQMLRERTYQFLEAHEDNLREVVETMFAVRTGAQMSPEELQAWGERVLPMYEDARKIIQDGNQSWREVLTEDQRKIHDEDLQLMERSLATTDDQIRRIVSGDMTVDEFRNPRRYRNSRRNAGDAGDGAPAPRAPIAEAQPVDTPNPEADPGQPQVAEMSPDQSHDGVMPGEEMPHDQVVDMSAEDQAQQVAVAEAEHPPVDEGAAPDAQPGVQPPGEPPTRSRRGERARTLTVGADFEGKWDQYVKDFITRYTLDDQQSQQANAILADCKEQGRKVVRSKQTLLTQLDHRSDELRKATEGPDGNKKRGEELAQIEKKKQGLFEPLNQIFENSLKPRLEKLPTRAQRKLAEESGKRPTAAAGAKSDASRPGDRNRPKKPIDKP